MKSLITLFSILVGLVVPANTLASINHEVQSTSQNSISLNQEETFHIAKQHQYIENVINSIQNNEQKILNLARQYSNDVRWTHIRVDKINENRIKLNIFAKIGVWPDPNGDLEIYLFLNRDNSGNFSINEYDWRQHGGFCGERCDSRVSRDIKSLPHEYGKFNQVLYSQILR